MIFVCILLAVACCLLWSRGKYWRMRCQFALNCAVNQKEIEERMESIRANLAARSFDIEVLREELPELFVLMFGQTPQFWKRKLRKDAHVIKEGRRYGFL